MSSLLILIVILPLLGAAGILTLSLISRLRSYTPYVALGVVIPTAVLALVLRWGEPVDQIPSLWQPSLLFGVTPMLWNDTAMQSLAFVESLAACVVVSMMIVREGKALPRILVVLLILLAASFVALWSANPLTMIVGWAIYDLVLTVGNVASGNWGRPAIRGLIFGGLATLLLWGGTLLSTGESSSALWRLMTPSDAQLALWVAAGVLRLWVYPFHLVQPGGTGEFPSFASFLLSPILGWGLCLRLVTVNGGIFPDSVWVSALAALTLGVGGLLAWSCKPPRAILSWVGMGVTGAVLLAVALAGDRAALVISSGCAVWMLGMTILFSTDGIRQEAPWWSIPALVGSLALLGAPLTFGFVSQSALLGGIIQTGRLGWGIAFFFGNLFLVAALTRWLLVPALSPSDWSWRLAARGAVLGLPAVLLLGAGLYIPLLVAGEVSLSLRDLFSMPGLAGWLVWAFSLALGGVLAWQDENVRYRIEFLLDAIHDLLCLEWLYDALIGAMDRGLGAIRAADEVVGGAGALLWSLLLFLLLLMIWSSR